MRQTILSVPFDPLTSDRALRKLMSYLKTDSNHLIVTPNPEMVMLAQRNKAFMQILQGADMVLADGIGILLAARIRKIPIPTRVPGCDIAMRLLLAGRASVYLLGAAPGVAEAAAHKLQSKGIQVLGAHHGYFGLKSDTETAVIAEIQKLQPDILLIGMGMPRQEEWAASNLHILPCKITICVGGAIDVFAGHIPRAPLFMRRLGLEWLFRLMREPSRIGRMLELPRFVLAVLLNPKRTFGQ